MKWLIACDLSDTSFHALKTTLALTTPEDTVTIVNFPTKSQAHSLPYKYDETCRAARVRYEIVYETPSSNIGADVVNFSNKINADIVVVGSIDLIKHQHRGDTAKALGSVAQYVIINSVIPIMVVHLKANFHGCKFMAAIDFSSASHRACNKSIELVKAKNSKLILLHISQPTTFINRLNYYDSNYSRMKKEEVVAAHVELCSKAGVSCEAVIDSVREYQQNAIGQIIREKVDTHDVDFLVIGARGISSETTAGNLGSVAEYCVRHINRPIIIVK